MKAAVSANNELIRKRRKRRAVKRTVILITLLVSIVVILALKLDYFNIKNIKVTNNKVVNGDEIVNLSQISKGTNIFYINSNKIQTNLLNNPYIVKAEVKRRLPSTIEIIVKEREAVFYGASHEKFYIIDRNGIVLEGKDDISGMNLTRLEGFDFESAGIGKVIASNSQRKLDNIALITELISLNTSSVTITSVNLADDLNIKVNCGGINIRLGSSDIKDKLNLALNIIMDNNLKDKKGYIDVSFEGNPVLSIEN